MKYIIYSLLFLLIASSASSQSSESAINLNPVIPPSPRTKEFEKYIDYKVSLVNGLAETNINFYTISLDGIKIPIGISYHASGIKHGQTSGDVGLGWSFDPGYRISRNIYGRADEYYTMPPMDNIMYELNNDFSTPFQRDYYLSRFMVPKPGSEIPVVSAVQNDYLDGQYDIFTLGLPDQSGKFIISNRTNKSIVALDNDALGKIDYSLDFDNLINKFDITDNDGIKYKFGEDITAGEGTRIYINGSYKDVKTAWMLKEITSPFGRKINLSYGSNEVSASGMQIYSREIVEGAVYLSGGSNLEGYGTSSTEPTKNGTLSAGDTRTYTERILSDIVTPYEHIGISRNTNSTISTIQVTRPNGEIVKKIQFYYTISPSAKSFLDSVVISDGYNKILEKYRFEYTTKEAVYRNYNSFNNPVDGFISSDCDYVVETGDIYYKMVRKSNGGVGSPPYYTEEPTLAHAIFCGQDKRYWGATQDGMLRKITFPTGGSREFQYESNQFKVLGAPTKTGAWSGLRIAQIKSYNEAGVPILVRNYTYPNGAVAMFDPHEKSLYMQRKKILVNYFASYPHIRSINKSTQQSILDNELSEALSQPNNGWYDYVVESDGLGKTEYRYQVPLSEAGVNTFSTNLPNLPEPTNPYPQYYLSSYNFWNKPQLIERTTYKSDQSAGTFTPIQKEVFQYSQPNPSPSDKFIGIKVMPYAIGQPGVEQSIGSYQTEPAGGASLYAESGINSAFNYATYYLSRGYPTLYKKITTDYENATTTSSIYSEYEFKNSELIRTEKVTNSNNDTIITRYTYPSDYMSITGSDNISNGIKNLLTTNTLNPVIEKSIYTKSFGSTTTKLVSSTFNAFKPASPVPDKLFAIQFSNPVSDFDPSKVQGGVVTIDSRYIERISFNLYSNTGELLEQQKNNDVREVYLWGYNGQYPVAKLLGTNYDVAKTYISQYVLDNATGSGDDAVLRNHLASLRNIPGTMVYTYTYKPLVGLSSETDPSGKTTYYEYDEKGRLSVIKNDKGFITRRVCYNYAGEPQNCTFTYYNNPAIGTFTKQCTTGTGSEVTYTIPSGKHTSTLSQEDADQKAQNDIALNGQNFANTNGTCPLPFCGFGNTGSDFNPGPTNMNNNGTTVSGYFVFYPKQIIYANTDYLIVTINAGCTPSNTQTINKTIDGRSWTFTILTNGSVYGRFTGNDISPQSQVLVSNINYTL